MTEQEIKDGAPSGATHIDKSGDYWKIVGYKEAYFYDTLFNEWVRYAFFNECVRYAFDHNEYIKLGYIKPL